MNGLQSLERWQTAFNDPDPSTRGLLNAAQNIGSIASLPLAPYVTDGLGRRQGIFWGSILSQSSPMRFLGTRCLPVGLTRDILPRLPPCQTVLIGVVVQATSHQIGVFIASRAIIGAGLTFATNA